MPTMPKGIKFVRALREGWRNFLRSGWLSASAILTTALALFIIGLTAVETFAIRSVLEGLEERMDITVTFDDDVSEERILAIRDELGKYREVASIRYVSRDEALEELKRLSDEAGSRQVIDQALEEIGENPLFASLSIKAERPEQYEVINTALENASFRGDVFRINYRENREIIEQLRNVRTELIRQGSALGIIFLLVAFLVTFNTIRLTMHARREDFEVLRLVGASNLSLRTPSVFEGIIYGSTASILATVFLYGYILFQRSSPFARSFAETSGLMNSFVSHIVWLFLALFVTGSMMGAIGGFLAVRRYLKV